jgi:hypothetical protein
MVQCPKKLQQTAEATGRRKEILVGGGVEDVGRVSRIMWVIKRRRKDTSRLAGGIGFELQSRVSENGRRCATVEETICHRNTRSRSV